MKKVPIASQSLRALVDAAGAAVDSIKLNGISNGWHRGRPLRMKRRRLGSEAIAGLANIFFPLANAHVTVCANPKRWQRWEIHCYHLLNGPRYRAFAVGPRTVCAEKLPGVNLRKLVTTKKLTRRALEAAGREIARVHRLHSKAFDGPWSHGDLHMGNVIYDKKENRARLIDFEIIHDKSLPAVARHADDLLVFLQELVGFVSARKWVPDALCFLDAYGRERAIAKLNAVLEVPGGVPGLWWTIRANYLDHATLDRRFKALRRALDDRAQRRHGMSRQKKSARRS